MKDFKILRLLDKLMPLIEKTGVDYWSMRKILQVKLLMDGRRVPTVFSNNKKSNDTDDNKFLKSLGVYILMGLVLIPFVIMKSNYMYQMSIVFSIVMFFITTSLISDFSAVLLDVGYKNIIGTKPVGSRTIGMAKVIHLTIYLFNITISLIGPALLVSLFTQGAIFFLVFLVTIVLLELFIIALTALLYFLILRFFDGEKLKDIINYIQIILTMVISIGYQLVGRVFSIADLKINFIPKWWHYFIAPIWFSAPFQMIKNSEISDIYITFTILAIVIPITAFAFYIKFINHFEDSLQKLNNNHSNTNKVNRSSVDFFAKLLCRDSEERLFYRFASNMMRNVRQFKLKIYPLLGLSIILPFVFIFQILGNSTIHDISSGKMYFLIYFCGMMLPTLIWMIRYSEKYKGAWIYKSLPIRNVAPIFKGTIKAFLTKLFLPIFILESIIFTIIFGTRILPELLIVLLNILIFTMICFMTMKKSLPFSEAFESAQQDNSLFNLLITLVLALLAAIHFGLANLNYGVYILLVLGSIVNLFLWKAAFNISSEKLIRN
ncbi:MAG: hypothetical protein K0R71_2200 [Bacillales bacterium]|jgi:hypothetical protein|nr:hypothetical protein [Bacillales bacterium]